MESKNCVKHIEESYSEEKKSLNRKDRDKRRSKNEEKKGRLVKKKENEISKRYSIL